MKVATKLLLGFGLLITAMSAVLILHFSTMRGVVDANRDLSALASRLALNASEPGSQLDAMEEMARKYQVTGDLRYAGRFEDARGQFEAGLRRLEEQSLEAGERQAVEALRADWDDFRGHSQALVERLSPGAVGDTALAELDSLLAGLRGSTRRLSGASQAEMLARIASSAAAARRTERISWAAVGVALLLSIVVSVFIIRSISEPLRRLAAGTRAVAEGDFDHRLEPRRDDEFSRLARDFNLMTERLAALERAKQDFLSQVSHDLKTPLAAMREAAALLLDEIPGPLTKKQRRLLELSQRSGERLSSMISKLLDLARMEAGAVQYELRREDLAGLARGVAEEFETRLTERELSLRIDLPTAPLLLECDGNRMGQVLGNLLENAVKFSPPGGTIRLSLGHRSEPPTHAPPFAARRVDGTALEPRYAYLEVADEGSGVPPGREEAIFEKFHQLEAGKRVARGGVGLGLAVCREIVTAHGGAIWVKPSSPDDEAPGPRRTGRGAVFRVLLPGVMTPAAAVATVTSAPAAAEAGADAVGADAASEDAAGDAAATGLARTVRRAGLPLLLLLLVVGCGASRFDRLYQTGSFEQALTLYEASPELQERESALYQAAQMRARPGSSVYDPEAARRDLRTLLDRFPRTAYRDIVLVQLALLDELVRLRDRAGHDEAALASLEREVEAHRQESERLTEELAEREDRIELLRLLTNALRDDLEQHERRLATLEQELERLKAIDLGPP